MLAYLITAAAISLAGGPALQDTNNPLQDSPGVTVREWRNRSGETSRPTEVYLIGMFTALTYANANLESAAKLRSTVRLESCPYQPRSPWTSSIRRSTNAAKMVRTSMTGPWHRYSSTD